jgi:putative endonuclease
MDKARQGGWVYIMANRYCGAMYIGVTTNLAKRVFQHRNGDGSDHCARNALYCLVWAERGESILECIAHEKRLKRWQRAWKIELIEKTNPDRVDLFDQLV